MDLYLRPVRAGMQTAEVPKTKPTPLARNSIKIRTTADEGDDTPGLLRRTPLLDVLARCGAPLIELTLPQSETDVLLAVYARFLRAEGGWQRRRRPGHATG